MIKNLQNLQKLLNNKKSHTNTSLIRNVLVCKWLKIIWKTGSFLTDTNYASHKLNLSIVIIIFNLSMLKDFYQFFIGIHQILLRFDSDYDFLLDFEHTTI